MLLSNVIAYPDHVGPEFDHVLSQDYVVVEGHVHQAFNKAGIGHQVSQCSFQSVQRPGHLEQRGGHGDHDPVFVLESLDDARCLGVDLGPLGIGRLIAV